MALTPKERAKKSADALWANDKASPWFGVTLSDVDEGKAQTTLTVAEHHTNGHNICHGGVIFLLADSAFAFACNSRNLSTVAQMNTINFLAPGRLGDVLTARAEESHLKGRSGIYEIVVTNQNGEVIASMRGCSRAIGGTLFEEDET